MIFACGMHMSAKEAPEKYGRCWQGWQVCTSVDSGELSKPDKKIENMVKTEHGREHNDFGG